MKLLNNVLNVLIRISKAIMVILMTVMVISMFFQVVTRYAMGTGIPWTEELARFSNVWLIFIGASVLVFADEHIKVTILDGMLTGRGLRVLHTVRQTIYLLYSAAIVKVGIDSLNIVSKQTSPNMLLSMNYIYVIIPAGAIMSIVYIISGYLPKKEADNG